MPATVNLAEPHDLADLRVFLERLQVVGQPEVRVVTRGGAAAVFGCTQAPSSLTDPVPVVLVMRAFRLGANSPQASVDVDVDVTVAGRAMLDRLARAGEASPLVLPDTVVTAAWAGVLPPTGGWNAVAVLDAASLSGVAQQGMERVAGSLPDDPGEAVVRSVRTRVWGVEVAPGVPAAAAFAAETMGFLRGETEVRLARTLTWTRLTTGRGEVVVRNTLG